MPFKSLLESRGIKQKWLAEKIGVSEVTVSNWSSGKSSPSNKNLKKLSQALDVSVELISKSIINEDN